MIWCAYARKWRRREIAGGGAISEDGLDRTLAWPEREAQRHRGTGCRIGIRTSGTSSGAGQLGSCRVRSNVCRKSRVQGSLWAVERVLLVLQCWRKTTVSGTGGGGTGRAG